MPTGIKPSQVISQIQPSKTLAVAQKAAQMRASGQEVFDLSVGEPDSDTPQAVCNSIISALEAGKTRYTPVSGIPNLRAAIQEKFASENNLNFDVSEITVGCGAKQLIYSALFATLNQGDEVLVLAPFWTSYPEMVKLCGGVPVIVSGGSISNNFKVSAKDIERAITPNTRWIIINSPSNPNGSVYSAEELRGIADVLQEREQILIMSDDIYEHIIYDSEKFQNILSVAPELRARTLIINGVSKSHSMTGLRLGYCAGPKSLIDNINKFHSNTTTHPASIVQWGAVTALRDCTDFIDRQKPNFARRRNLVASSLKQIESLSFALPDGAFYFYISCERLIGKKSANGIIIEDDTVFASELLSATGVAVVPGAAFGLSPYFRLSFAASDTVLENAISKIAEFCKNLVPRS